MLFKSASSCRLVTCQESGTGKPVTGSRERGSMLAAADHKHCTKYRTSSAQLFLTLQSIHCVCFSGAFLVLNKAQLYVFKL